MAISEALKDKEELIFDAYCKSLDLDLALSVISLSEKELDEINADEEFVSRLMRREAEEKQGLIQKLRDLANPEKTPSPSARLSAIEKLGMIVWPSKFGKGDQADKQRGTSVEIYTFEIPDNKR